MNGKTAPNLSTLREPFLYSLINILIPWVIYLPNHQKW
ncbi:hypothetical protein yaldo0001_28700 [Yersinia aldovae ATCC 35236]|nr:hypothetical protein yaldo0001_28700 [Yersinia aldovae ATCC 35236]